MQRAPRSTRRARGLRGAVERAPGTSACAARQAVQPARPLAVRARARVVPGARQLSSTRSKAIIKAVNTLCGELASTPAARRRVRGAGGLAGRRRAHRVLHAGLRGPGNLPGEEEAAGLIDHVNNLKLQYLVELSQARRRCAGPRVASVEAWLARARRGLRRPDDPVRAHAALHLPRPAAPGRARGRRALDACSTASATPTRTTTRCARSSRVSPSEDSLIRIDPGFPRPMRICRLDAFLTGYDVKFLEFNADSPAGIGYTDILHEGLDATIDLAARARRSSTPPTRRCCPS